MWVVAGLVLFGTAAAVLLAKHAPKSNTTEHVIPVSGVRSYSPVADCLLTDPSGIQGSPADAVWTGMQAASVANRAQMSYLAMQGPNTSANAEIYINTLAMRGCTVILAAGPIPAQAAYARAAAWPHQRLVTVTATTPVESTPLGGELTAISGGSDKALTTQVKALLLAIASGVAPTG